MPKAAFDGPTLDELGTTMIVGAFAACEWAVLREAYERVEQALAELAYRQQPRGFLR